MWAVALVLALGIVGATGWRAWESLQATQTLQGQLAQFKQQAQQLQAQLSPPVNPRHDNLTQAAKLLQQDLGKVFAVIENLKEEGVRLRAVKLDAGSGTLHLEYELDTLARAAAVTALLNAGYETRPWHMENVGAAAGNNGPGFSAPVQALRAKWVTQLDRL